ncbi:glycosyltransferase [Parabacteroides sp. BX2]|jgi:glycosyltransferase involved in cell wall biosynthesis|uniref:Glycosyltransferase n=1 Tax=Parabacteroides segnis TaxID=2763058 RepID=A0ABR7E7P0_9BACT|nr:MULTISPECIES: glycosyltransferase [Parabacteroides]MBC5645781.1 glycosyltransferase [Parabacteroides segnis]MCM0715563.1 glycosyltransferase [Parabacteroides sp. TA-V-105]
MRILYCGLFRFPAGDAAAPRVLNNAKIMRKLGHKVDFIAFGGKQEATSWQGFNYVISDDLDIKKFSFSKVKSLFMMGYKAYDFINSRINEYDVVVLYFGAGLLPYKLDRLCCCNGVKFVLDITEWYVARDYHLGYVNPFFWINEGFMRFVNPRVKNVICISRYLDNHFRKSSNRLLLPPLVDLNEEKWKKTVAQYAPYAGKTLIYAGNAANSKDRIDIVLEALEIALDRGAKLRLLILGSSKVIYTSNQQREKLKDAVCVIRRVTQEDVPRYYKIADFSILIRDNNRKSNAGFATKLAETIAAGVPPIINKTSNIEDYLKDRVNAIVLEHPDKKELVKRLIEVDKMDTNSVKVLSEAISNTARCSFHYESYIESMKLFLRNLKY